MTERQTMGGQGTAVQTIDFDLHGLAGIRVVDAGPADVRAIERQLGPLPRTLDREPEITLRFVDRFAVPARLRYLGAREAGWTDDGFFVLRSRKTPVVVRIPMDRVGGRCEIVCERGLPAVPFLIAILNLTVLVNGALPLHAAAFELDGVGTLVTGWSKGGKTELLMAAAGAGARYIGDEWIYLTTDGRMHGIPEPIRLWDWHLAQLPAARTSLGLTDHLKLRGIPVVRRVERALPGPIGRLPPGRLLRRAMPVLEDQLHVDLPPETLFGAVGDMTGSLDRILFVVSAAGPETTVEPIDPLDVAARMVASLMYERRDFLALWQQARFAHPGMRNDHIESFEARQRDLLERIFAHRPACVVTHPYPVDIHALFEAVRPAISPT
ncbi:MAG TPA: hypothetical protein VIB02_06875 [Candidatus Limnocylindrales bacterium]